MMDAPTLAVAVLGSSVITGVATGLIGGWFSRKRTSAEATQIIANAAARVVETLNEQNDDLRADVERLKRQAEADRKAQQLHVGWDMLARERLKQHGVDLPEPPPLYAPEVA